MASEIDALYKEYYEAPARRPTSLYICAAGRILLVDEWYIGPDGIVDISFRGSEGVKSSLTSLSNPWYSIICKVAETGESLAESLQQ